MRIRVCMCMRAFMKHVVQMNNFESYEVKDAFFREIGKGFVLISLRVLIWLNVKFLKIFTLQEIRQHIEEFAIIRIVFFPSAV